MVLGGIGVMAVRNNEDGRKRRSFSAEEGANSDFREGQFLKLYGDSYPRIYACILTLLPDKTEADEILQETSLVLWKKFNEFDLGADFVRWACGIAYNEVRKYRRLRGKSVLHLSAEAWERVAAVREQQSEWLEGRRRYLAECVDRLPESDRILLFRCCEGVASIKQVSEELGRPANTVYKAIKRIRTALKRCVDLAMRRESRP